MANTEEIDKKIANMFNQQADIFPENLAEHDPRLKNILKVIGSVKDKKILDVGCAKGRFVNILTKLGADAVGIEPAVKLLEDGKKLYPECELIEGSATSIPFKDNKFDIVICVEVIEHVPGAKKAISEMKRVLKKGGVVIVIDKNLAGISEEYPLPAAFWKRFCERRNKWMYPNDFPFKEIWYRPKEFKTMLEEGGFSQCGVNYFNMIRRPWQIIPKLFYFCCWYGKK